MSQVGGFLKWAIPDTMGFQYFNVLTLDSLLGNPILGNFHLGMSENKVYESDHVDLKQVFFTGRELFGRTLEATKQPRFVGDDQNIINHKIHKPFWQYLWTNQYHDIAESFPGYTGGC